MEKLDLKDRKIIYYLDLDSRQSFAQIGKKVGLHKDAVAYRVNNLLEKGIIKFVTSINEFKVGINYLRFFLTYQYTSSEAKKEIIDFFVNNPYSVAVHSAEGHYNLVVLFAVKNTPQFFQQWNNMFCEYRDHFSEQVFSVLCDSIEYKFSFLLDEKDRVNEDRALIRRIDDGKPAKIDELDIQIIKLIHNNARMPTTEIAKKLNSTAVTINSRIKKLVEKGVILGFRALVDYSLIGYQYFKVDLILKDPKRIHEISDYIVKNPHLMGKMKSIGHVDLELVFFLQNANHLYEIMNDLTSKFPEVIRNYNYYTHTKTYKYQYLPEG
jgi:Lrp/AsnC family transcriptional regulator for asnA, asnC and gidA